MTRFEESALRVSVATDQNRSNPPPYWHATSHFSALIDPRDHALSRSSPSVNYPLNGIDQTPSMDFSSGGGQGDASFASFNEFESMNGPDSSLSSGISVKTPTGSRSMRRPGLAGAPALVNGQYRCQWSGIGLACRHRFLDAKSLNDHVKSHHVHGAGSYICQWSGCDKGNFPTANKLVRHIHSHTGYKPFPCGMCSQAFVTKDQLDKHLTTHTGAKDFVCSWEGCGRSFAVKHALDGHINSVHLKSKKHICPHCNQAFDDSSNLSKHKKQVHNAETGIRCPARHTHSCGYIDSRKDKMKEHCENMGHGLEIANDPHAWNLWVQQFKSSSKKAHSRRASRDVSGTPMSRASSICAQPFAPMSHRASSIECSKEDCNLPVCLPCNILCNDFFPAHEPFQPCDDADCDPCDPCNDTDCDPDTRQPCIIEPCTIPHCRSPSSTPSVPPTPQTIPQHSMSMYGMNGTDSDPFAEAERTFQLNMAQLTEYMGYGG